MSQYLAELCTLLVEDTLGTFFSHIFSALATYGRLDTTQLAAKCRLPPRQIRYGLSVLVQAQLVYHHTSSDQRTSYEANFRAAYDIVRNGKIIHLAKETLGHDAALVVGYLLSVGQVTVQDLHKFWEQSHGNHDVLNGGSNRDHTNNHVQSAESAGAQPHSCNDTQQGRLDLSSVLTRLIQHGFVLRQRLAHFRTPADNYFDAQAQLLSLEDGNAAKGRKSQDDLGARVKEEMASRNDASISVADLMHGNSTGLKRPAVDSTDGVIRKKKKLTNGASGSSHGAANIDTSGHDLGTFAIRINHDKVAALLRNRRLVDQVRRTIGPSAAQAYMDILEQSTSIPHRWERRSELAPEDEDFDTRSHLIDQESLLVALTSRIRHEDDDNALPSVVTQAQVFVNGYVNGNHSTEVPQTVTMNDIKKHLLTLAQPPHNFVFQDPDSLRWMVDFGHLSRQLRREEAMRLARSRLNGIALRVVRVLLDNGKLDEKALQELSLLSAKDLRQCLARLKKSGFLGLQEVPKDAQHQPLKTIYLWFYDSDRVRKMMLGDLYKAIARLMRRLKVERDKVGPLLEKAERIDVRGKEEKFLAVGELEVLDSWRRKEEWLLGEVERLDDSVAILRDI